MDQKKVLESLNLPADPVGVELRLVILSHTGNRRTFRVFVQECELGDDFVRLEISTRQIKGIRFDRLVRHIVNNEPVDSWIASPLQPTRREHDAGLQWQVLEFTPLPAAG